MLCKVPVAPILDTMMVPMSVVGQSIRTLILVNRRALSVDEGSSPMTGVCFQSPSESYADDGSGDDCISIGRSSTSPSVTSLESTSVVSLVLVQCGSG